MFVLVIRSSMEVPGLVVGIAWVTRHVATATLEHSFELADQFVIVNNYKKRSFEQ